MPPTKMHSDTASSPGRRILTVCLYVPITPENEYLRLKRSVRGSIKASALRVRDRLSWTFLHSHRFDYPSWCTTTYTNRGDIAIRDAIRQLLSARFPADTRYLELEWGKLDGRAIAEINAKADLFVICGGGYVSGNAMGGFSRRLDDTTALSEIKCPVVAFGVGYNALMEMPSSGNRMSRSHASTEALQTFGKAVQLFGVRDRQLQDMLNEVGSNRVELIGDPALFLKPGSETSKRGLKRNTEFRVGINFAVHGPVSAHIFQSHFPVFVRFLKHLQNSPYKLYYFVHCRTEHIALHLFLQKGIAMEVIDVPPAEMVRIYGQMDVVLCQMLHSSILATNAGTPSANIAYDQKNISFYSLMGLSDLCLSHRDLTDQTLSALFERLKERRQHIAAQIQEKKAALRERTVEFAASTFKMACSHTEFLRES